ncbi:MAG TPA: YebC/PmpR family DNA-binding transcriptional regulator [Candidatus Peribacteraceae bacterium]|nr:YebC/PmpR family DNA-binding transcriptional regulator [Candidatus Peribacteraceae bacterium]
MSGHSKWHNIRVKKTAADAKRGKIFTRHAKLIEIAAQRGGDPDMNPSLRTAIDNAKADSVPNANIERAIKKGSGELKGDRMEEIVYAAYGPGNTAMIIECLTDNKNRTLGNIRTILSKNGANFAESGSVLWMFQRAGIVSARNEKLKMENGKLSDDVELGLIDAGAQDIETDDDMLAVTTNAADWTKVRDLLKQKGFIIESAGLKYVPTQKAAIGDVETAQKLLAAIEAVESDDDVSEVHTNADISAEVASQL